MAKISVIIPVYNVENYLKECLDSILNQSFKDIEVICIDDGSTDNSLEILKQYAKSNKRIKILCQRNLGAGAARNAGLAAAAGKYVHFMDGDDIVFKDFYKKIYRTLKKKNYPNIVEFRCKSFDNITGTLLDDAYYELFATKEYLNRFIDIYSNLELILSLNVTPWCCLYKKKFLTDNKIYFNHLKCCNDRSFHYEAIIKAKKIFLSGIYGINYRTNIKTSLRGIRDKYFDCHFKSINIIKNICEDQHLKTNLKEKFILNELDDLFYHYDNFINVSPYSDKIRKNTVSFIKNINIRKSEPELIGRRYYDYLRIIKCSKEIRFNYYRTKLLSKITFGKLREHYKEKRNRLKSDIRKLRELVR